MLPSTFTYIVVFAIIMLIVSWIPSINAGARCLFATISMFTFALCGLLIWNVEMPVVLTTDEIIYIAVFQEFEMTNGMWIAYAASIFALISLFANIFAFMQEQKVPRWKADWNRRLNRSM